MDVIVGLGNPGQRYQHTRHNIGFEVIDALAQKHGVTLRQRAAEALCGSGQIETHMVLCAKPQTYMNASGQSVAPLVQRHLRRGDRLIIIHDDIDLPLGKMKIKHQGGDAGHLGIRSIIACLARDTFIRLRLGVGRPAHREDVVAYVLSPFTPAEKATRDTMITQAVAQVETLLTAPRQPE